MTSRPLAEHRVGRRCRVLLLGPSVVAAAALVGACVPTETPQSCISWVSYEDDAARAESADVVVDAVVHGRAGSRPMFGVEAAVWEVETTAVLKGDIEPGEWVEVASTPVTCTPDGTYPRGDPLDVDGPVRLFLHDGEFAVEATESGLALITPSDGVGSVID